MSLDAIYPWLKALHVAAALTFVGGVMAVSVFLRAAPPDDPFVAPIARGVRRWDQMVTTPAMLLVWGFGLTLAMAGHWFAAGWLQAKFVLVVILSGLHGVQSGRLRRAARGAHTQRSYVAMVVVGCAVGIALVAVAKPRG